MTDIKLSLFENSKQLDIYMRGEEIRIYDQSQQNFNRGNNESYSQAIYATVR